MTKQEALTRVKTGNFDNGLGFDPGLLVDAVGAIGEMLKSNRLCEVVRCKDCKEYKEWNKNMICMRMGGYHGERTPDDFCSLGIRR